MAPRPGQVGGLHCSRSQEIICSSGCLYYQNPAMA
jgi:hypothetical protein